jgi:hypothetical protein
MAAVAILRDTYLASWAAQAGVKGSARVTHVSIKYGTKTSSAESRRDVIPCSK